MVFFNAQIFYCIVEQYLIFKTKIKIYIYILYLAIDANILI